ncbi:MAG: hypothetical protein KDM63_11115 [Verrucomicrobiae bacterium]|nr:hypothetical protein [Verrucomicrobiae bacterium]
MPGRALTDWVVQRDQVEIGLWNREKGEVAISYPNSIQSVIRGYHSLSRMDQLRVEFHRDFVPKEFGGDDWMGQAELIVFPRHYLGAKKLIVPADVDPTEETYSEGMKVWRRNGPEDVKSVRAQFERLTNDMSEAQVRRFLYELGRWDETFPDRDESPWVSGIPDRHKELVRSVAMSYPALRRRFNGLWEIGDREWVVDNVAAQPELLDVAKEMGWMEEIRDVVSNELRRRLEGETRKGAASPWIKAGLELGIADAERLSIRILETEWPLEPGSPDGFAYLRQHPEDRARLNRETSERWSEESWRLWVAQADQDVLILAGNRARLGEDAALRALLVRREKFESTDRLIQVGNFSFVEWVISRCCLLPDLEVKDAESRAAVFSKLLEGDFTFDAEEARFVPVPETEGLAGGRTESIR